MLIAIKNIKGLRNFLRKRELFLFFFFVFCGCSSPCHQWKLSTIRADCPSATYSKIYLPACNTFNGLEAVFIVSHNEVCFYLYSLTLLFPYVSNDQEKSLVFFTIDGECLEFEAERLQGGQCLLLPNEAMKLTIDALLQNKGIEINVGRYKAMLISDNFYQSYQTSKK